MRLFLVPIILIAAACGAAAQDAGTNAFESYRRELAGNPASSLVHYRIAEIFFRQNNFQSAANEFRSALNGDNNPKWTIVWSHIQLGKIFDITSQHERAVNEYRQAALTGDNTDGARDEAITHLEEFSPDRRPPRSEFIRRPRTSDDLPLPVGAYRVSKETSAPEAIEKQPPEYSDEARIAELEGTVFLTGVIGEDGKTREMQVTGPLGLGLDEKALQAISGWRFRPGTRNGAAVPIFTTVRVDFLLPLKHSRWHLIRTEFRADEGVSRPVFLSAPYPPGAGVSKPNLERASLVAAAGRQATATLSFEVDEHGSPNGVEVDAASGEGWGDEAVAVVRDWKFTPGTKNGEAVPVQCVLMLAWGQRTMAAIVFDQLLR